jgi:hypothetical protein
MAKARLMATWNKLARILKCCSRKAKVRVPCVPADPGQELAPSPLIIIVAGNPPIILVRWFFDFGLPPGKTFSVQNVLWVASSPPPNCTPTATQYAVTAPTSFSGSGLVFVTVSSTALPTGNGNYLITYDLVDDCGTAYPFSACINVTVPPPS